LITCRTGQHVVATVRGHVRCGVLTKVARSRVTMEFSLASGAPRTATLYAAQVHPQRDQRRSTRRGPLASFGLAENLGYGDQISNRVVDAIGDVAGGVHDPVLDKPEG
jgi:hypothetical protein